MSTRITTASSDEPDSHGSSQIMPVNTAWSGHDAQTLWLELEQWAAQARKPNEWRHVIEAVNTWLADRNMSVLIEYPSVLNLYARALFACEKDTELEALVTGVPIQEPVAIAHLLHAGSLVYAGQLEAARWNLEQALAVVCADGSHWQQEVIGLSWRYLAQAQHGLGQPWRESLERAKQHLKDRQLGLAWLQHGHHLEADAFPGEAQNAFAQALHLLEHDPHASCVALCNLAVITINNGLPGAAQYVQRALKLVQAHTEARPLKTRALRARGALERSRGELERAHKTYHLALNAAKNTEDRAQAIWGIAHTLRLQHHCTEALEWYMKTEDDPPVHANWVWADRAACLLELGDQRHAQEALEHLQHTPGLTAHRAQILRAELARRDGQIETALELLRTVPTQSLAAREEAPRWPELFALAKTHGLKLPKAISPIINSKVEVNALGVLRVRVNGRPVNIPARGKLAELLVYLLEADDGSNARLTNKIQTVFYPELSDDSQDRKVFRTNLYDLERRLRIALGWEASVLHNDGVVQLDPDATWQYDVRTLREQGLRRAQVQFMSGVYSDWVAKVEQDLRANFMFEPA